ncbi:alpha-galactosidase, partial [Parabacteroides sp. OttesenSCG-928-G06]|nr:alpha-galactosidase [Parabacteroides sp. OttesenSCG-928-G06]
ANLSLGTEAYIAHGMEDYFEPAVRMLHNDGNPSLLLKYVSHTQQQLEPNVSETVITLSDDKYPVTVKLFFVAFAKENIIKEYTEISHKEKKPVTLYNYASSMLHLNSSRYYLTEFAGDWAHEVNMTERQLDHGKKILDTKLGSRANMFCSPIFLLSLDKEAQENSGDVLFGTINWTGNFRFTFEVDQLNRLRIISGINPYASEYTLQPNEVFRTPEFVFTYSTTGKGQASRNFHRWALKYQLKDGDKSRLTLLNNWEATYFNFDEQKLVDIMDEAVKLGVDMFLLDDGWFANKYPRSSDRQGLGDWEETVEKLPNGIGRLVQEATDKGIKFGLWIEPEMVNPKSELYEKHKDWVIHLPNRDEYYFRSQMVLDLSNPKVQDYVYNIVDNLMTKYPGIAYFKWDCNSPITNIYSPYLKDKQSHLYIEHVRGLYNILDRIKAKYPDLPMMLCSGGGGRSDYKALEYFTEFWASDNTDPVERIFIQWGFGHFFPAKSMAAHVTSWGKQPIKFRTDVAMMCKLGFDIRIHEMNDAEQQYCREAVQNFKRLEDVILNGDIYRLVSPYETDHASIMYVTEKKEKAIMYAFDIHPRYAEQIQPVRLQGLDPDSMYEVKEINLLPGTRPARFSGNTFSGDYLMKIGLPVLSSRHTVSHVFEITKK